MRLAERRVATSGPGRARLEGRIIYQSGGEESLWFDVPEAYREDLTPTGDPWAVAMLPIALKTGEPLELDLPVDPVLAEHLVRLGRIWRSWYPDLHDVPIELTEADSPSPGRRRTASFFSGGVDSFHTVLRNREEYPVDDHRRVADLILIHGADIPVDQSEVFGRVRAALQAVSSQLGVPLLDVATNLRQTRFGLASWPHLTTGAGLAAAALALQGRFGRVLIPSSISCNRLNPWGSHPLTDPLFSTQATEFLYDSAELNRREKIEVLASSDLALANLRVCWQAVSDRNCGRCGKCLRTMITLDILGARESARLFPAGALPLGTIRRFFCRTPFGFRQWRQLHGYALGHGRRDIADAIATALDRSARLYSLLTAAGSVGAGLRLKGLQPWLRARIESSSSIE